MSRRLPIGAEVSEPGSTGVVETWSGKLPTPATVPFTAVVVTPSEPDDPHATTAIRKTVRAAQRRKLSREKFIE